MATAEQQVDSTYYPVVDDNGTGLEYEVRPTEVKENIVLSKRPAQGETYTYTIVAPLVRLIRPIRTDMGQGSQGSSAQSATMALILRGSTGMLAQYRSR
jgi:hypothetical protein